MTPLRILMIACSTIALAFAAGVALAAEDTVRFLRALQESGYGDMAVEYLEEIKNHRDLPPELRETWDLEMSKSLKLAANDAFDAREYETLIDQSQKYLAKFIKEKSDHPEATFAMVSWADYLITRALDSLRRAKNAEGKEKDKDQYEKHLNEARAGLLGAQEKYREAETRFLTRLAKLPPTPKQSSASKKSARNEAAQAREEAEADVEEARFQIALIDYYLTQTDADPKSEEHFEALRKTAKAIDDIFQRNRVRMIGLYAHMWHGKILEELGDYRTALDIYEEVLANAPEPTEKGPPSGLESLFTQVEQFRLNIVARRKPLQYLSEALAYLKNYERLKQSNGYQGIALDAVNALLDQAENATGPEKNKLLSEALRIATDGSKVPSQYQRELFAMRRDILQSIGRNLEVNTFEDAMSAGDAARESSQWPKALENYNKAIEIAEKTKQKTPKDIAAAREAVDRVRFLMACELYNQGKMDECLAMAGGIVRDDKGNVKTYSTAAAQASALGIQTALNLYATALKDQKSTALEKLLKVAEFTEKNWPGKPEADDARMARGQAKLVDRRADEAIEVFERVNSKSERYPTAMYWAGHTYWLLYVQEKQKNEGRPDADRMAANRAKAVQRLQTALNLLKRQYVPGGIMPPYLLETQLMLGEIELEGGNAKQAAALFQPLIDALEAEKSDGGDGSSSKTFDPNAVRVFLGAARAYCALDDLDKAGTACASLIELGPDTLQVNDALVDFARLLNADRKKADDRVAELKNSANADEVDAAKARQASIRDILGKTLAKLAQRQELGLGHLIFIGGALNDLDQTDAAGELFQKILKRSQSDPEFAKRAKKAMSLIRSELLKILRKQRNFDAALQQVDPLIADNPNALEPLMEKGRILEALAEKDPAKYGEAVAHWTMLRNRMQGMLRKPNEYYDVVYGVAHCLLRQAETNNDKTKAVEQARMAEQVLKSPMILAPKLNGPETVAKYQALVDRAILMQGRSPEPKDIKQ